MDSIKNALSGGSSANKNQQTTTANTSTQSSGGGWTDKVNSALGGGHKSEQNEDALDKGVDFVQERVLGQGAQNNESALEQAKDEQISDFIRGQYKGTTGKEFFVKDK
ncbi:hypothetical protein DFH27DRAFT_500109 [Peziza echinospora]|nr:hypothetical protein DFH27DRAFT_500109 [Peziza echinospora]